MITLKDANTFNTADLVAKRLDPDNPDFRDKVHNHMLKTGTTFNEYKMYMDIQGHLWTRQLIEKANNENT